MQNTDAEFVQQDDSATRHPLFPPGLSDDQVEDWLRRYASEKRMDQAKNFFSDEQISTMAISSSHKGAEMLMLEDIQKKVTAAITGGVGDAPLVIEIPITEGTKLLKSTRANIDQDVRR